MNVNDTIKAKADQYDVQGKAKTAAVKAQEIIKQAVTKLGDATHKNRAKLGGMADKGAEWVDKKSNGKYSKQVTKARGLVDKGLDKVAQQGSHTQTTEAKVKENIDDYVDQTFDRAESN